MWTLSAGGPDWTPITPITGSLFHAETHAGMSMREDAPSPHDLRRTASTRMAALGVPKEDRDACLNHARVDVGKHYDLYERAAEKRKAFTILSNGISSAIS